MKRPLRVFPFVKRAILLLICVLPGLSALSQDCGCDFVINPPASRTTSLFIDGDALGVQPGQTVCLKAGFYLQIRFVRISGEPGNPVTIKNCGGLVEIGDASNWGRWYATDIVRSSYIRYTGTGDPDHFYGIKLGKSGDTALKIGLSTDVEVDHLEIGNANFAGIMAKTDYRGNPPPDAPEMNNINIHDNYIHDTRGEGMYIGETKSPGENMRHLEVWNNIITRTGLDFFQVANVVEDIQVHHNVFYRSGLRNVLYQNKGMQIGDNSVGRYYNNIVIESPSNSMIIMGSGDIEVKNNYFSGAGDPGFFIDNRTFTLPEQPIIIQENFIMDVNETAPFFNVFNEVNPILIAQNYLEGSNVLVGYGSGAGDNVTVSGNTVQSLERVQFVDADNDNFALAPDSPYEGLGLLEDAGDRNRRPFIARIASAVVDYETTLEVPVSAGDPDGDALVLEAFDLPPFVSFQDNGNGKGLFTISPQAGDEGVYYKLRVRATDSKGGMNSQHFTLTVLDPYAFLASASSSQLNLTPENTLDEDLATRWAAAQDGKQWIMYDLREDKLVTSVGIAFHEGASIAYSFGIETSENGVEWMNVFEGESTGATADFETFAFDEIRARYLRIVHSGTTNSYNEVMINCTVAPVFHTFKSTDDLYVEGRTIYNNHELRVKDPSRSTIIRFAVKDLNVNKAPVISVKLRFTAVRNGHGNLKAYLADSREWSESTSFVGDLPEPVQVLDTLAGAFAAEEVYEVNAGPAIGDNGDYNFVLKLDGSKGAGLFFSSAEGHYEPELVVVTLRGAEAASVIVPEDVARSSDGQNPGRSAAEVKMYPNPVHDKVTVDFGKERSSQVSVEIADQEGTSYFKKSWKDAGPVLEMNLGNANLDPGVYLLKLEIEGDTLKIFRFLKK